MNQMNTLIVWVAVTMAIGLVSGCRKPVESNTTIQYLLPRLRHEPVNFIELRSHEGTTVLTKRDGVWWVDKPVDYFADQSTIENFLRNLTDVEIGKKIKVSPTDLHELGLDEGGSGISVRMRFGENEETTLIFGKLDYPKDNRSAVAMGLGFTARRYIKISGEKGGIYFVPVSMVDLSAASKIWTDTTLFRIPSFRRLSVKLGEVIVGEYYREYMFGPLLSRDKGGNVVVVNPNLVADFEFFLKRGWGLGVGLAGAKLKTSEALSQRSLIIEDFVGISYTFHVGLPVDPSDQEAERANLQAGFLSSGDAPVLVPLLIEVSAVDLPLNRFDQSLKESNLAIMKRLSGHIVYTKRDECHSIIELLESSK